jgi:hypothetical protein
MRIIALALLAGCAAATFRPTTQATFPPIADRAVAIDASRSPAIVQQGRRIGTIATSGTGLDDQQDLADKAAIIAMKSGGTHVITTQAGEVTNTYTTPASESTTCTDNSDASTCTTTYTPESTTTVTTPWADFDVYRVESARWQQLPEDERPLALDPSHHTPTANDGFGHTFGYYTAPYQGPTSGMSGDVFPTAFSAGSSQAQAFWYALSYERGSNVLALDYRIGGGSLSGTAINTQDHSAPVGYTLDYVATGLTARIGKRITFDSAELAAGAGLAGALFVGHSSVDEGAPIASMFVEPPGTSGDVSVPVWASLTVKPSCNWGVQGLAEYDLRPFTDAPASPAFAVGLIYQPASACL